MLDFWQQYGKEKMRNYMYGLVNDAGESQHFECKSFTKAFYIAELLQKSWGTNLLCDKSLFGT